ncbi:LicD family protein [Eggerthellaceae bacterium zg-893]|nr:LicD family protein [Eggerthellaceae bacterium zg-893]
MQACDTIATNLPCKSAPMKSELFEKDNPMKSLTIDDMKSLELDIMDEIDQVCREHGLAYFLGYGSLLGAVRHKGFIPWDDDMDILMPRKDYETFLANFQEWRHSNYYEVSFCRFKNSVHPFVKVIDKRTSVSERFIREEFKTGIWVDVFPLDDIPANKKQVFRKHVWLTLKRDLSLSDPHDGTTKVAMLAKRVLVPFARHIDPVHSAILIDENAAHCTKTPSDSYIEIVSMGDPNLELPKRWFKPTYAPFEDRRYCIPSDAEAYLSHIYGDWKTPPPADQRLKHTVEACFLD